jgi:hypothetical protein
MLHFFYFRFGCFQLPMFIKNAIDHKSLSRIRTILFKDPDPEKIRITG